MLSLAFPEQFRVQPSLLQVSVGASFGLVVAIHVTVPTWDGGLDLCSLSPFIVAGNRDHVGAVHSCTIPHASVILTVSCEHNKSRHMIDKAKDTQQNISKPSEGMYSCKLFLGDTTLLGSKTATLFFKNGGGTSWLRAMRVPGPDSLIIVAWPNGRHEEFSFGGCPPTNRRPVVQSGAPREPDRGKVSERVHAHVQLAQVAKTDACMWSSDLMCARVSAVKASGRKVRPM